jgi:TetR/AcrR family transcriptional regulator, transcriptional repressor for nem operon
MPRVCRAETAKNRTAIRQASSRLFREQGLRASVSDVMSAAGLTHGGFYGHFGSKDELAAEACAAAFAESVARWRKRIGGAADPAAARTALIDGYLAAQKRPAIGSGCPIAALATDVARESPGKPVRSVFHAGLEQLIEILTQVEPQPGRAARTQALTELSTLVGAMVLARATDATPLSDELLHAAAGSLLGFGKDSAHGRRPHSRRGRRVG